MGSDLSAAARQIVEALIDGASLDELAARGTAVREEVETALRKAAGLRRPAAKATSAGESRSARNDAAAISHPAAGPARPVPGRAIGYSDGASRGNPGPAAYGIRLLAPDETVLLEEGGKLGSATNNVAEYHGLIALLRRALELGIEELEVRMDSELIVKQMRGIYRVKQPALQALKADVDRLLRRLRQVKFVHVPREKNREADELANRALDGK
ncbi:MAG: ribonuclease HI family protein [bacterium]